MSTNGWPRQVGAEQHYHVERRVIDAEKARAHVQKRQSLTSTLYKVARTSNNLRAARRGPSAYAKRVIRRKVYRKSTGATGRFLKTFGLK